MQATSEKHLKHFIGNEWTPTDGGSETELHDPSNNEVIAYATAGTAQDAKAAMDSAQEAFDGPWGQTPAARRGKALWTWAQLLWQQRDEIAKAETLNQGKPLREARADIGFAIQTLEYYAGLADKVEGTTIPVAPGFLNYTTREPMGVTVHIAPWNFPFQLAMRSIAPALAAGNTAVLKPASWTPMTSLAMAESAAEAGLPPGTLNVVTGGGGAVGDAVARHPKTAAIAFTGSVETGVQVGGAAASRVVPCTLELGGKSPQVVFDDARLDKAVKGALHGCFLNAGQMCWAGSRLLVQDTVADQFIEKLQAAAESLKLGPGSADDTTMGPLVSREHLDTVAAYIATGTDEARLVTGGLTVTDPDLAKGNFLPPTIFADVPREARIAKEEIFGPVLSVFTFSDEAEAVEIANDTEFGLYGGVWTQDLGRAHRMAAAIEAGVININAYPVTFPGSPFLGHKQSGVGSEQGQDAIEHYTRTKNVIVRL